jgi:UPF0176 protein
MKLNCAFYHFQTRSGAEVQSYRDWLWEQGTALGLKGKVVVAGEGINGSVCGKEEAIESFKKLLSADNQGIFFKDNFTLGEDFKRLVVKVKKEIITMHRDVDMSLKAPHISPRELLDIFESKSPEEFVLLDIRNGYEYDAGHFENSIKVDSHVFSEFEDFLPHIRDQVGKRTLITYCTGGIRCEKATALLAQKGGFGVPVYQLKGGILGYGADVGDKYWKGKCVVFDKRASVDIVPERQKEQPIPEQCGICQLQIHEERSQVECKCCRSVRQLCPRCRIRLEGYCSKACRTQETILDSKCP